MQSEAEPALFEAVIVPHRSLSRRALRRLILAIGGMCSLNAAVFAWIGAWPVAGFTGIELLLAAVMLLVNARGARASELVLLTEQGLKVVRTDVRGSRRDSVMLAGWLRVSLEEVAGRVPRLVLTAQGRREEIATTLGETEKRDLAQALANALDQWRHPTFDNPQLR